MLISSHAFILPLSIYAALIMATELAAAVSPLPTRVLHVLRLLSALVPVGFWIGEAVVASFASVSLHPVDRHLRRLFITGEPRTAEFWTDIFRIKYILC